MKNKLLFEEWLTNFKKGINGKKFNSVKSYLGYMATIEKHLDMEADTVYNITNTVELDKLEETLRQQESFNMLSYNYRSSLLSALHVYKNLIEIITDNNKVGK